ncbi:MAG: lipid-A-disaccharide synthase [Acidobacteriota bacterium]
MTEQSGKIMIVAGEDSGDAHAAKLVSAIREADPGRSYEFFGAAGPKMREMGIDPVVRSDGLSIVGLAEIGRALPMFLRASKDLKNAAATRRPDAVILVDFPDFNLKLAKALKKQGLTIIYYISPQLWAWRKYRLSSVKKYIDLMLTILPFEKGWYAERGFTKVEYVGSPLAREVHVDRSKDEFCREHDLDPSKPLISLLPGSRHKEIVRILPVMLRSAVKIANERPNVQFVVAMATSRNANDVEFAMRIAAGSGTNLPANIKLVENETYNALNASDAAAVTSGTATLETGIIGTPMVIVYKTSKINYSLLEPLISVPHYGLINLIAGERVANELIQKDFTAESLSAEILRILDPIQNGAMRLKLQQAVDKLGHGGASKRAAESILRLIRIRTSELRLDG